MVSGFSTVGRLTSKAVEETQRDLGGAAEARRAAGRGAGSHRNGVTGPVTGP